MDFGRKPMNNRELENLIRMAMEVEDLEGSRPALSFDGAPVTVVRTGARRVWLIGGGLAAAAALTLAAVAVWPTKPSEPSARLADSTGVVGTHEVVPPARSVVVDSPPPVHVAQVPPDAGEKTVLLAIFRDADDRCSCVQLRDGEWSGRKLADIGRSELLRTAMARACNESPEHVLVIAIAGPAEYLPSSDQAEVLAACVFETPSTCGDDDSSCYTSAAMACLPAGMTVKAETLAMK